MKIIENLAEWQTIRQLICSTKRIGFVPTMGNLHAGHASLYEKSITDNDCTVASLFVNPTQFNQSQDFTEYPRTIDEDCQLLAELGVDYCLIPSAKSMYADDYHYQLTENKYCQLMEGAHREGHFNGVLTVVMKLFNLVKPHRAYFGEKDYQQFLLIRGMAEAFFMGIDILSCPTVREKKGLAFSSRNNRLTPENRILAEQFARIFHQAITRDEMLIQLQALGIEVEYIEEHEGRRYAAVKIGGIRLIDNYAL